MANYTDKQAEAIRFSSPIANRLRMDRMWQYIDSTTGLRKAGDSTTPVALSSATNAEQLYVRNSATSGDSRALYLRQYLSGAGGGGEALRAFSTIEAAGATAHGAHLSLNFGASGKLTGLGAAIRGTLHLPNVAGWNPGAGTLAAIQAEIYSDGDDSDPAGLTELSCLRVVNDGGTGKADVDDDAFFLSLQGFTAGAAHMFATGLTAATVNAATTAALKCKIGATTYYIPLATAIA